MKKVACIVKGYPRLSETFIAQELKALEDAGIPLEIYSLRRPTDTQRHPLHAQIRAPVHYLPEYLYRHPYRVIAGFLHAWRTRRWRALLPIFWRDFRRDCSFNRIRRLGQAVVLAREITPDRNWLYVHFLHTPASVAYYAAILTDLPWSCSAHAKDIWTLQKWEIAEKLTHMQWLVTCTQANENYLRSISEPADAPRGNNLKEQKVQTVQKVKLLYHGLDLHRFPPPPASKNSTTDTLNILSVGRAVPKKGYDILLRALAQLPTDLCWQFVHIGDGPLRAQLQQQAQTLNLAPRMQWLGARSFNEVLTCYRAADLFILPSRIDANGDRDGMPNVLLEAMSQALPCIATNISGIPELITTEQNGLLVPSEDADTLAHQILRASKDPILRHRLGTAGQTTVTTHFSLTANINNLINRFW